MHLKRFNGVLYEQLIAYPQEVIPVFDMAATELFIERLPAKALPSPIQVRPFNLDKMSVMRQMNPEGNYIEKWIAVENWKEEKKNFDSKKILKFFLKKSKKKFFFLLFFTDDRLRILAYFRHRSTGLHPRNGDSHQ